MCGLSRSTLRGAPSGGVLQAGSGSGTCERWETQPRPRAVLGQPRRALRPGPVRPRSKAQRPRCRVGAPQGAGRDVSRPGPGDPGPPGSNALPDRSGVIQAMRLVARRPPRLEGTEEERKKGDPLAQSRNRGRFSFDSAQPTQPHEERCIAHVQPQSPFACAGTNGVCCTDFGNTNHARRCEEVSGLPPAQGARRAGFAKTKPPQRKHTGTQRHNAYFRPDQRILARLQYRFPRRIKML
jgi:hypothetical protein